MPIAKKHSNNIKPTDGRKGNGKNKQGIKAVQAKKASMTPARLNQAKKDQIGTYALKAMKKVFGSEEEAWETLAEKAKDSFAHMNLLFQYRYGKPMDKIPEGNQDKSNAPVINFFASPQQIHEMQETIDIDAEEVDADELNEDN
tara:strand:- start:1109 stop:1540 length:432 start_codon:yes stop_codon:yes gene_type:complete